MYACGLEAMNVYSSAMEDCLSKDDENVSEGAVSYSSSRSAMRVEVYTTDVTSAPSTVKPALCVMALSDVKSGMSFKAAADKHGILHRRSRSITPNSIYHSLVADYDEYLITVLLKGYAYFGSPLPDAVAIRMSREIANKGGKVLHELGVLAR